MIILDTNVISELLKETPNPAVVSWADSRSLSDLALTTITVYEVLYGLNRMPKGVRKARLVMAFDQTLRVDFKDRIQNFDHDAAVAAGRIAADLDRVGRPRASCDIQIAGIVSVTNSKLATRNTRDFADMGIPLINPWEST